MEQDGSLSVHGVGLGATEPAVATRTGNVDSPQHL